MIKQLVADVVAEVKQDLDELKRVHGGLPSLAPVLERICARVEKAGLVHSLKGADKRELAIEAALALIDRYVPPKWAVWLPEPAVRWVLGRAIDGVVKAFKRTGKWAF